MTQADVILRKVFLILGIEGLNDEDKFGRIEDIVDLLGKINNTNKINIKTTGTISERLCEIGLRAALGNLYNKLDEEWKWMGDFYLKGSPFNIIISVKSFKAKERLLASGSGHLLSPTIGFGLFNDKEEWTSDRVRAYLFRGFIAIYMPKKLLGRLPKSARQIKNISGKTFLRSIESFIEDLRDAVDDGVINPKLL